jgi:hypothetical protein
MYTYAVVDVMNDARKNKTNFSGTTWFDGHFTYRTKIQHSWDFGLCFKEMAIPRPTYNA